MYLILRWDFENGHMRRDFFPSKTHFTGESSKK